MTSVAQPIYALCGSGYRTNRLPSYGRVVADDRSTRKQEPGWFCGLPWGIGDPAAAFLGERDWAVVRIGDPGGPVEVPAAAGSAIAVAAVKFRMGAVVYNGDPRGAIETLVQLGADARAMSVKLALPDETGVADAGAYGIAIGGRSGLARGGDHSRVLVESGYGGVAVAGRYAEAVASCDHGIAAAGAHGRARAGAEGLALLTGAEGFAFAGERGIAVAMRPARRLGSDWLAVALSTVRRISVREHGILVVREAKDGLALQLGKWALAVLRFDDGGGKAPRFLVAGAGPGKLEPDAWYVVERGELNRLGEDGSERSASWDKPDETKDMAVEDHGEQSRDDLPPIGIPFDAHNRRPLGDDVLVLCRDNSLPWSDTPQVGLEEPIEAEDWDEDPNSRKGLFGIAWGICNEDLAAEHLGWSGWMIVRASEVFPGPVPEDAPLQGLLVKFRRGEVVYRGPPGTAIEMLIGAGVDPDRVIGGVAEAPSGGIARVGAFGIARAGRGGWAIAGACGEAMAGEGGLAKADGDMRGTAMAGRGGLAIVESGAAHAGERGVAICDEKRYGEANAGAGGVAVALGSRFATVKAGDAGLAVGNAFGVAQAGHGGIAIGLHQSHLVSAGRGGIAIGSQMCPTGAPGCLLVVRGPDGDFRSAVVGEDYETPAELTAYVEELAKAEEGPSALPDESSSDL